MDPKTKPSNAGSRRLFSNPVLELLTKTHISITLILYSVLPVVLLVYGFTQGYLTTASAVILFVLGIVSFTLVEYLMHRFLFHIEPSTPFRKRFATIVHGSHHEFPRDKARISMPPIPSVLLATFFFLLFRLLLGTYVFGFLPGFYFGYMAYSGVHYAVHAYQPPKNFLKVLWIHHGIHHYKDPDHAFGVSTPLWDMLFRTMPKR